MNNQNQNQNTPQSPIPEDDERVFKLHGEIESEKNRLKKRRPKNVEEINDVILGTLFPLMAEVAHYTKENASLSYEILDQLSNSEDNQGTQFLPAHAEIFEFVLTYARESARATLESGVADVAPGTDAHKKLTEVASKAEECLKIIEDSTLESEEDLDEAVSDGPGAN